MTSLMLFQLLIQNPAIGIAFLAAIVYALTVHEFSHALAGRSLGDPTAEAEGRLTLNPLKHIDLIGFLALVFVGFGWGKPVPFNPHNLKNPRWGPVIVALAGPLSNIVSIFIFGFSLKLLLENNVIGPENLLATFLAVLIQLNVILALFNLIPIPPLDGSKLLYAFLPPRYERVRFFLERYGIFLLLFLLVFSRSILSPIFDAVLNAVYRIF